MSPVLQRGKTHPQRLKLSMEMVVSILLSQGLIYPFHLRFRGCTKHEPMDDHLVPSSGLGASRFSRAISTKPAQFQCSLLKQCWEAYNATSRDCDNDLWTAQPQITVCQEPLLQNLLPDRLWKHFIFYMFTIYLAYVYMKSAHCFSQCCRNPPLILISPSSLKASSAASGLPASVTSRVGRSNACLSTLEGHSKSESAMEACTNTGKKQLVFHVQTLQAPMTIHESEWLPLVVDIGACIFAILVHRCLVTGVVCYMRIEPTFTIGHHWSGRRGHFESPTVLPGRSSRRFSWTFPMESCPWLHWPVWNDTCRSYSNWWQWQAFSVVEGVCSHTFILMILEAYVLHHQNWVAGRLTDLTWIRSRQNHSRHPILTPRRLQHGCLTAGMAYSAYMSHVPKLI